jgi:hypothetical protein
MTAVWMVNAVAGRSITAGVQQQVGDRYILDKYPPPARTSPFSGPSMAAEPAPETPKSPANALWPNLR